MVHREAILYGLRHHVWLVPYYLVPQYPAPVAHGYRKACGYLDEGFLPESLDGGFLECVRDDLGVLVRLGVARLGPVIGISEIYPTCPCRF